MVQLNKMYHRARLWHVLICLSAIVFIAVSATSLGQSLKSGEAEKIAARGADGVTELRQITMEYDKRGVETSVSVIGVLAQMGIPEAESALRGIIHDADTIETQTITLAAINGLYKYSSKETISLLLTLSTDTDWREVALRTLLDGKSGDSGRKALEQFLESDECPTDEIPYVFDAVFARRILPSSEVMTRCAKKLETAASRQKAYRYFAAVRDHDAFAFLANATRNVQLSVDERGAALRATAFVGTEAEALELVAQMKEQVDMKAAAFIAYNDIMAKNAPLEVKLKTVTYNTETGKLQWAPVDGAVGYIVRVTMEGEEDSGEFFLVKSSDATLTVPTGKWSVAVMPVVCDDYSVSVREEFIGPCARTGGAASCSFAVEESTADKPAIVETAQPICLDELVSSAGELANTLVTLEAREPFEFSHEELAADFKDMSGWPRFVILSGEKQSVPVLTQQLIVGLPGDYGRAIVQVKRRAKGGYGVVGLVVEFNHLTLVEKLLEQLRQGYGIMFYDEEFGATAKKRVVLNKTEIKDPQGMFDELLQKLSEEQDSKKILGGSWLAMKLDRSFLGKKRENQARLVDYLAGQMTNETSFIDTFMVRALASNQFADPEVFSDSAKGAIAKAVADDARVLQASLDPTYGKGDFVALVAKVMERDKAVELIETIRKKQPTTSVMCAVYLARLGIEKEQQELVARFRKSSDMREKYLLAYALSIWGGKPAQEALAEALRTPGFALAEDQRPMEMISLHIARALVRTVQEGKEELPQKEYLHLWTAEDMAKVEEWVAKHLGTKWTAPRPEFQAVPMPHF